MTLLQNVIHILLLFPPIKYNLSKIKFKLTMINGIIILYYKIYSPVIIAYLTYII